MRTYSHRTYVNQLILLVTDILLIFGGFRLVWYVQRGDWWFGGNAPQMFAVFSLLWWTLGRHLASPDPTDRLPTYSEKIWALARTLLLHAVVLMTSVVLMRLRLLPVRYWLLLYTTCGAAVMSGRLLMAMLYRVYRARWARPHSRFVIVGASNTGLHLHHFVKLHDPVSNYFLGFFADASVPDDIRPMVLGGVHEVKDFCLREQVDEIYFALPLSRTALVEELSAFADEHFVAFRIVPDFEGTLRKGVELHYNDYGPVLTVRRHPLGFRTNQVAKRLFDLTFSGLVIVGVFPVLLPLLALLIKIDSPGPVFFKQMRPGKRNKLFPCYKLRTMRTEANGTELQATRGDVRVTRVGRFLRASSLDEIPQFFNVWLGHMSVVGPRPHMLSQLEEYSKHIHTYPQRHVVTPGITGYAQVNGYRGETRAEGAMEKRVEYDLKYVENWSLLLDVQIIGKTVWNMIGGEKNAY